MPRIKLDGPHGLEKGDRVYIDGAFAYDVIEHPRADPSVERPSQATERPIDVPIRYADGGTGTRTFEPDVSWQELDIEVER